MKIKLLLNVLKRNNYVFYDKVNKLHLSLSSPVGFANTVSQSVKRAILAGNIIDINNVTGIEVSKAVADRNELVLQRLGYKKKEQVVLASSEDSNKNEEDLSTPAPKEDLKADDKSNEAPKDPVNEEPKEDENADESAKEEAPKAKTSRKKNSKKDKEEEKAGEE